VSAVQVGSIRLWDEVVPALQAGLYRLQSSLEIVDTARSLTLPPPPTERTHFLVTGTRFALGPDEISECHPPQNAVGGFGERLPHVTLKRRSLPWERRLSGGEPWLAVVVAAANEADLLDPKPLKDAVGDAIFARLNAREAIADKGPAVRTLVFKSGDTLRSVLPAKNELALLSHVRQVNLADSAVAGADDDGWFAVVAANRLPLSGSDPTPYIAAVVSLEERDDLWTLQPGAAAPPLVVLFSWTFTTSSGGTFEHEVKNVDVGRFGEEGGGGEGAVALARTNRAGGTEEVRYATPFLGEAPAADRTLPEDPGDVTAEAAFELGRMLGAADGRFTREIVAWHRATDAAATAATLREDVAAAFESAEPLGDMVASVPELAEPAMPLAPSVAARLLGRVAATQRPADPWQVPPAAADLPGPKRRRVRVEDVGDGARLQALAGARSAAVEEER
jgi:hypothetical protein